ncbi:hypothetical protein Atai01_25670 [Amycolatopsis taiwanensis]|uniref:Uncharacterized protein n=1 Tax=Amycolatopsis taiwanensis TaxID=342230 RepID=A0A9W6VCA8_9PSEU|nr:hypothetical protein Atai01_25670 [Amycolatopsis taiwanensis]
MTGGDRLQRGSFPMVQFDIHGPRLSLRPGRRPRPGSLGFRLNCIKTGGHPIVGGEIWHSAWVSRIVGRTSG